MRVLTALTALLLLAACAPDVQPAVHEVNLVGSEYVRITWFYGEPRDFSSGDGTLVLTRPEQQPEGAMTVSGALSVNGQAFLREPLARLNRAPTEVKRVGGSSDMRVRAGQDAAQVLYYDGDMWFTLLEDVRAGQNVRVVPVPRLSGLQGVGQLTRREAQALQDYLGSRGPVALTVLDEIPGRARTWTGVDEYLRSGFYVQRPIGTLETAPAAGGTEVFYDVIAGGNQAISGSEADFRLLDGPADLIEAWASAHANLLSPPAVPAVDFTRESVLALFLGQKPGGGYGISVENMSSEGGELYADVRISEPGADQLSSQALTSPWQLVRILRPDVHTVWLRDAATGEVLGAASR